MRESDREMTRVGSYPECITILYVRAWYCGGWEWNSRPMLGITQARLVRRYSEFFDRVPGVSRHYRWDLRLAAAGSGAHGGLVYVDVGARDTWASAV